MNTEKIPIIDSGEEYPPLAHGYTLGHDGVSRFLKSDPTFVNPVGFVNLFADIDDGTDRLDVLKVEPNGHIRLSAYSELEKGKYFDLGINVYPLYDRLSFLLSIKIPETTINITTKIDVDRENCFGRPVYMEEGRHYIISLTEEQLRNLTWKLELIENQGGDTQI